jgi:hypothetical protein
MEAKQLAAVMGILSFLGTVALLAAVVGAFVLLKFLGEERLSRWSGHGLALRRSRRNMETGCRCDFVARFVCDSVSRRLGGKP